MTNDRMVDASFLPLVISNEALGVVSMILVLRPDAFHPWRDSSGDDLRRYTLPYAPEDAIKAANAHTGRKVFELWILQA